MATIQFNVEQFREQFPLYASEEKYPDALITGFWPEAVCLLTDNACCDEACLERLLYLMVAHLLWLNDAIALGEGSGSSSGGILQYASIVKISVSVAAPPFGTSSWKYWLNQTPYGQRILAMLAKLGSGGFYVSGRSESRAFRKFRGLF
jgi:hypothetical protein